jgi:hypothetical protein
MRADSVALAKEVLYQNWRGSYTIPSGRLYPFQWNWDAGFHALGWAYIDIERSFLEVESMFKGQWKNGMLPHVVFHEENEHYFPGPSEWEIRCSSHAPDDVWTTGITQLPVFGFIVDRIAQFLQYEGPVLHAFLERIYPKILAFHRYLFKHRDPNREGLVYIQHNWESADNSPMWDEALAAIDIRHAKEVSGLRKDNLRVDASHRPSDDNYKRYIHLITLMKAVRYEDEKIAASHPFLIQDIFFNALLLQSNIGLLNIAKHLQQDTLEIQTWIHRSTAAINQKLWNEEAGFYFSFNLKTQQQIQVKTSAGFLPMFAGICNTEQAEKLTHHLTHHFIPNTDWKLCPSTAADEASFDALRYWRGPVWVNVNWMIYHGLKKYRYDRLATQIKEDTMQLIEDNGMYEYFDARPHEVKDGLSKAGLGADSFSWTAVIYLDFLNNQLPC